MTRIFTLIIGSLAILSTAFAQNDAISSSIAQMTEPSCTMDGSRLVCSNIESMMEDMEGNPVFISSSVSCDSSPSKFDFRQAEGCTCTAEVTTGSETKLCGCTVCPSGYGLNPLSVDCGDADEPYVLDTCTTLDCNFDCNGKCTGGCDVDPLPAECVSLCTRDGDMEHTPKEDASLETASDIPSDVPSDIPSDLPSDMPSDLPSRNPTMSPTLAQDNTEASTPSASPTVLDVSSSATSPPYRLITFALTTAATAMLFTL